MWDTHCCNTEVKQNVIIYTPIYPLKKLSIYNFNSPKLTILPNVTQKVLKSEMIQAKKSKTLPPYYTEYPAQKDNFSLTK